MTELRVFVCRHIFEETRPVLLIANTEGNFSFLCGDEHEQIAEEFPAVGLNHVLYRDKSFSKIVETLPINCEAERKSEHSPWEIKEIPHEDLE